MNRRDWLLVRRPLSAVSAAIVLGLSMPWLVVLADQPPSPPSDGGQRTTDKKPAADDDVQDFVFLSEARPILMRVHLRSEGKSLQAEWSSFVQFLFSTLDKDADGSLNREELERLPAPQLILGGSALGTPMPTFASIDSNKDGKVTQQELTAFFRRQGGAMFQVQASMPNQDAQFAMRGFAPPSADALNDALFKLLDKNDDGKLSNEELAQATTSLLKLDSDDNEVLTVEELVPNYNPLAGRRVAPTKPDPRSGAAPMAVVPIRASDPRSTLTRQLQNRYAGTGSKTRLTREQLGLDQGTFDLLDQDKDEELDSEELGKFGQRPPELEMVLDFSKSPGKTSLILKTSTSIESSPFDGKVRSSDGGPTLDLGSNRIEIRAESAGSVAISQKEVYRQQFRAADQDTNGYLDENEARRFPQLANNKRLIDRDGDGMLFEKEVMAFAEELEKLTARAATCVVTLRVTDQGRGLLDLLDANRDGNLSLRELRNAAKLVEQFDRDGDGLLTRAELPRSQRLTLTQGPATPAAMPALVFAARARSYETTIPALKAGPVWFRKMDRNRDGDVSRREFLGSEVEFRRIDGDGDGLISLEEAERADVALRRK